MARRGHVRAIAERTAEGGGALVGRAGEAGAAVAGGSLHLAESAAGEIAELASGLLDVAESASRRLSWRTAIGVAVGIGALAAVIALLLRRRRVHDDASFSHNGAGRYGGLDETLDDSFPSSDAPATEMSPGV